MNSDRFARHVLIAFLLSLALYVLGYWFIESRRATHTPWRVAFNLNSLNQAELNVRQDSMGLGPVLVRIEMPITNLPAGPHELLFDTPRPVPFDLPLGKCLFQDTTFFPGTVVLEISGIKIQMLPRVLTIGTNEFPWKQGATIVVDATGTPRLIE